MVLIITNLSTRVATYISKRDLITFPRIYRSIPFTCWFNWRRHFRPFRRISCDPSWRVDLPNARFGIQKIFIMSAQRYVAWSSNWRTRKLATSRLLQRPSKTKGSASSSWTNTIILRIRHHSRGGPHWKRMTLIRMIENWVLLALYQCAADKLMQSSYTGTPSWRRSHCERKEKESSADKIWQAWDWLVSKVHYEKD